MITIAAIVQVLSTTPLLLAFLSSSSSFVSSAFGEMSNQGDTGREASSCSFDVPTFSLRDGNCMPQVGLGVYRSDPGKETYRAVRWALKRNSKTTAKDDPRRYRLFDTAQMYENEESVGQAIHDFLEEEDNDTLSRKDIFITTKLDTDAHGYHEAIEAINESLRLLGTTYIDLMLIHSPYGGELIETWDAFVALQKEGKVKSIGVSNFGIPHLEALREHGRVMPVVNQLEMHPLIFQKRLELIEYCKRHDIVITAYGSLFSGYTDMYEHPTLVDMATKYNKTVPQILLHWALQNGFAVIPKSTSSKKRQKENINIFDFQLTKDEMENLSFMKGEPLDEYWNPVDDASVDLGELGYGGNDAEKDNSETTEEL